MALYILLFAIGLLLLIKGGDWFVDGATGIAHRFHLPEILIGATVVSIGTTLPEVMVSATSALSNHGEMAYGNAIGSIICNTSLIAAITIAIKPAKVNRKALVIPAIFFLMASIFTTVIAYTTGFFDRWVGIVLLIIFLIYITIQIIMALRMPKENDEHKIEEVKEEDEKTNKKTSIWKDLLLLVVGAAVIAIGADLLVDNGCLIASELGVPESVIALTFIALGTSLPELVTAITSLIKGHSSLSLGNIIGANLFNFILVMGVSNTLAPFMLPQSNTIAGINSALVMDIPVVFLATGLLLIPTLLKGKVSKWQGYLLLLIYVTFTVLQFVL
ncbi:MAG: calcium/sodium antiporter [Bacilli bacterium]|nr:calcium/sodium antiporter [Bacilli bacterium]